ncbi:unnamed protein product [Hydatigera taeniaeformis]|uniref:Uncharacterized protein n=1 Tax=Hydatigena taeniaeformis TaxID=6205 RepID=A0A0R3X3W5_HYDTA|nr:unnamed protein product [Hydatigera taeniaeformis]
MSRDTSNESSFAAARLTSAIHQLGATAHFSASMPSDQAMLTSRTSSKLGMADCGQKNGLSVLHDDSSEIVERDLDASSECSLGVRS